MPRFRMPTGAAASVYTKRYTSFRGVDFSSDPSQVSDDRSPYAVNVMADAAGCPKKRPGWAEMAYAGNVKIHGIHRFKAMPDEHAADAFIVHAGGALYVWHGGDEELGSPIMTSLTGESSAGFMHDDKLYILTGEEFICVKAEESGGAIAYTARDLIKANDCGYIPLTRYNCNVLYQNSSASEFSLSGSAYDAPNIATRFRRNTFNFDVSKLDTSIEMIFRLDADVAPGTDLSAIELKTAQGNVLKGGELIKPKSGSTGAVLFFTNHISDNLGFSSTTTCPSNPYLYIVGWRFADWLDQLDDTSASFTVTYPAANPKKTAKSGEEEEIPDYYDRIRKCRFWGWFNSRLFLSGNPDYPNADWYSEVGEPTYFKEINYTEIGNDDSPILGYLPAGDQQAIIKGESRQLQDASIYLRRAEWEDGTGYIFPVKKGVTGTGAVGIGGFGTLIDDAMYLSRDGVMGIVCENITGERVLAQRSTRVNAKLLREQGLDKAVCGVWNGYFIVAVNGRVYLADSRQRTYARNTAGNFEYEWYYWEGLPISCICVADGILHFGTADGSICTLLSDVEGKDRLDDWPMGIGIAPRAISAVWSTPFDDDGDFMLRKHMTRRGCGVFMSGCENGNVKVQVRTESEYLKDIAARGHGIYDLYLPQFMDSDVSALPPRPVALNRKVKDYAVIQVVCRSDALSSDFGVLGIERRFVRGRFVK